MERDRLVRALLVASMLTAGCETSSRSTPVGTPPPVRPEPTRIIPPSTPPRVEEKPRATPESKTGEFRLLNITPIGEAELILTRGKDNPGQGFYVSAINPIRLRRFLEERKSYVPNVNIVNSLSLIVSISKGEDKDSFAVKVNLGHSGEKEFRDSRQFEMIGVKDSSIVMVLSWLGWKLGDINWWEQESPYRDRERTSGKNF